MTTQRPLPLLLLLMICLQSAYGQEFIPLWPQGAMPNSRQMPQSDSIANERIVRVGTPGMWAFILSSQESRRGAVIICPGGGYQRLAYNAAGLQLAKWFNTFGVNAFVLKYRLPDSPDLRDRTVGPLQDAQRAMRIVRANARQWSIDPDRIGIMGTSAGGHLASTLGTWMDDVSAIGDTLDRYPFRPDYMILVSPVIDLGTYAHVGSREHLLGPNAPKALIERFSSQLHVTSATPPAFIVHAANDKTVSLRNSVMFYQALVDSNVMASLHTFPQGAHSIALRENPGSTELWTALCEQWMIEMKFVERK